MRRSFSVYHPVHRRGVFKRLDGKECLAAAADLSVVPLQVRLSLVRYAVRTNEMLRLAHFVAFLKPIHDAASWRTPKFIAVKIRLLGLRSSKRSFDHRQALNQSSIRDLDACHLHQHFACSQFDIRGWDRLQLVGEFPEFPQRFSCTLCRDARVFRKFNRVSDDLKIDIHRLPPVDSFSDVTFDGCFRT